jgi:hypothetical protein
MAKVCSNTSRTSNGLDAQTRPKASTSSSGPGTCPIGVLNSFRQLPHLDAGYLQLAPVALWLSAGEGGSGPTCRLFGPRLHPFKHGTSIGTSGAVRLMNGIVLFSVHSSTLVVLQL